MASRQKLNTKKTVATNVKAASGAISVSVLAEHAKEVEEFKTYIADQAVGPGDLLEGLVPIGAPAPAPIDG